MHQNVWDLVISGFMKLISSLDDVNTQAMTSDCSSSYQTVILRLIDDNISSIGAGKLCI